MEITINYYGQAVSVSVEVYEYLTQADHKAENLAHEQRRHWDGREFDEYIISTEGRLPYCATPEELVCQRETLDEILVLALCTDTQRERFLLYALYDFSYAEIAKMCGCSKVSVCQSIVGPPNVLPGRASPSAGRNRNGDTPHDLFAVPHCPTAGT